MIMTMIMMIMIITMVMMTEIMMIMMMIRLWEAKTGQNQASDISLTMGVWIFGQNLHWGCKLYVQPKSQAPRSINGRDLRAGDPTSRSTSWGPRSSEVSRSLERMRLMMVLTMIVMMMMMVIRLGKPVNLLLGKGGGCRYFRLHCVLLNGSLLNGASHPRSSQSPEI